MTKLGFSKINWMNYYLKYYLENTIMSSGETLKNEVDKLDGLLENNGKNMANPFALNDSRHLRKKIYGEINIKLAPYEINEYLTVKNSGYTLKEFRNLEIKEQGRILALEAFDGKKNLVEQYYRVKD